MRGLRLRSEWITVLTLTGLAVCGLTLSKHSAPDPQKRNDVAAAGVDYAPTGSARITLKKPLPHRPLAPHP